MTTVNGKTETETTEAGSPSLEVSVKRVRGHTKVSTKVVEDTRSPITQSTPTADQTIADQAVAEQLNVEQWLSVRKETGSNIDPVIAEVMWTYGCEADPYRVRTEIPEEVRCVVRVYWARSPGGMWVSFNDLPDKVRDRLLAVHERRRLAYPAGVEMLLRPGAGPKEAAAVAKASFERQTAVGHP